VKDPTGLNGTDGRRIPRPRGASVAWGPRARRLFQERCEPLADLRGHRNRSEVGLPDADQNVTSARDDGGRRLAPDLEVEVDRRPADPAEPGLDHEELVQLDGPEEVALDPNARQPDPERLEQVPVGQTGRAQELGLRERKEPQVRLIVDDPRGVDVLPADVFLDRVAGQIRLLGQRFISRPPSACRLDRRASRPAARGRRGKLLRSLCGTR